VSTRTGPNIAIARNAGLAACKTRWLAFLDDDEVASLGWRDRLIADRGNASAVGELGRSTFPTDHLLYAIVLGRKAGHALAAPKKSPHVRDGMVSLATDYLRFWEKQKGTIEGSATRHAAGVLSLAVHCSGQAALPHYDQTKRNSAVRPKILTCHQGAFSRATFVLPSHSMPPQ
jgi:hypothetical protein